MFDYHMHSTVSLDGISDARAMVAAAQAQGLREICFTDHLDYQARDTMDPGWVYSLDAYNAAYDSLRSDCLLIRRGMEFGLGPDLQSTLEADLTKRHYDFVIGSVHFVGNDDVYEPSYWVGKSVADAYRIHMEETLRCVQAMHDFDVLGHLTFICKARCNPTREPLLYREHQQIVDEILRVLIAKGIGLELNTSGMDRCGFYLPTEDFFRRYRELGGEIVTVGSDAHDVRRVGQYTREAIRLLLPVFGYVCTFADRKPIFHSARELGM